MPSLPVVDVGCYAHPQHQGASQDSVLRLIERFHPPTVYGFDPHPDLPAGRFTLNGTVVHLTRAAAWTFDGEVAYNPSGGLTAAVGDGPQTVACFDLARWLRGRRVVLKVDIEGGEYDLLEHLIGTGAIGSVEELLVEWHEAPEWRKRRAAILDCVSCPVGEWT